MIHTDAADDDDNDHPSIVANPLLLSVLLCAVATARSAVAAAIRNWIRVAYQQNTFFVCDYFCMIVFMRSMSFCIDVAARLQWQSIEKKRN